MTIRISMLLLPLAIAGASVSVTPARADFTAALDTLILINGDAVTSADIDAMIMKSHQTMDMDAATNDLLVRLLDKAVNDRLIIQEAFAMGLDTDPMVTDPLDEAAAERAVRLFVGANYAAPNTVDDSAIDAFFERMYHRIQLRQLSLATREEVDAARKAILDGADFAAMAEAQSLDTKRYKGGLHNFIHWADLEVTMREVCEHLQPGEFSEPFKYREVWSVVRVEQRAKPDWTELGEYRNFIRGALLAEQREAAWEEFIATLRERTPLTQRDDVLARVRLDADKVFHADFFSDSRAPAIVIDEEHFVSEGELRSATSRLAMEMGEQSFSTMLEAAIAKQSEQLVLRTHAERGGFFDHEKVIEAYDRELGESMITHYLNETIISRIRFDRAEFEQFYQEHLDEFRGPEQVRVSFLLVDDRPTAQDAVDRLGEGADFEYIRREMQGGGKLGEEAKWAPLAMFNPDIVAALKSMQAGDTSDVLPFQARFMVVRLDGRRVGRAKELAEVEMQIRQVIYQRKFKQMLDGQLDLLKERSEIIRFEKRIEHYFSSES